MNEESGDAFVDPVNLHVEAFLQELDAVHVTEESVELIDQRGVFG